MEQQPGNRPADGSRPGHSNLNPGIKLNVLSPDTFAHGHPWETYDALRQAAPVSWQEGGDVLPGCWVLTNYADIQFVSLNPDLFTSTAGFQAPSEGRKALKADPLILEAFQNMVLGLDPPEHTELRRIMQPYFMPRYIHSLHQALSRITVDTFDDLDEGGEIELVSRLSSIIPIKALGLLLGIPDRDIPQIFEWTNKMTGSDDKELNISGSDSEEAFKEVFEYGRRLLQHRRQHPVDDLTSAMATGKIDDELLSEARLNGFSALAIPAGNETTRNAMTGAVWLLSENPELKERLVADPALIPEAVEELLRRTAPVIQMMRTATENVRIGDVEISKGEQVVMLYGAANHDPGEFEDPYSLNLDRKNLRRHVAFGTGIHRCLGAPLARVEIQFFLRELLQRYPNFQVVDVPEYVRGNFVCAIKRLKLKLG